MRSYEDSRRSFHIFATLAIIVGIVVVYSNTLGSSFHFDDFNQISGANSIKRLDNIYDLLFNQARGVTRLSFALNYAFGGLNVAGFHIVNISIHIANSIFVYFILFFTFRRLDFQVDRSKRLAFFAALLFAVHPVQTQAVTYIIQRHESLAAFFSLLALLLFVIALSSRVRLVRLVLYCFVPICYMLAFKSKEVAITLAALIFIYDLYFTTIKDAFSRWPLHAVMAILLIFYIITSLVQVGGLGGPNGASVAPGKARPSSSVSAKAPTKEELTRRAALPTAGLNIIGLPPTDYLMTEFNVVVYYIALLIVPVNQNVDYDFPVSRSLFDTPMLNEGTRLIYPIPPPVVSLLIICAIVALALYLLFRSPLQGGTRRSAGLAASFFIFWFFIALSPSSSIIPIIDVIFEHRVYMASLGFFVCLVLLVEWMILKLFAPRGAQTIQVEEID